MSADRVSSRLPDDGRGADSRSLPLESTEPAGTVPVGRRNEPAADKTQVPVPPPAEEAAGTPPAPTVASARPREVDPEVTAAAGGTGTVMAPGTPPRGGVQRLPLPRQLDPRENVYWPRRKLGEGGFGEVWLYQWTNRREAWKLLLKHTTVTRQREGNAAAVKHPLVATLYDLDHYDGVLVARMEFVPGVDLQTLVERDGVRTSMQALAMCDQIAEGLAAIHGQNVAHLDVKPRNVVFDAADGKTRIIDFGISAALGRQGAVGYSPHYTAPEVSSSSANPGIAHYRADVFSLGRTMLFLLSGHQPDEHGLARLRAHGHCTRMVCDLIADLVCPDPERRVATMHDVRERLRAAQESLSSEPGRQWLALEEAVVAGRFDDARTFAAEIGRRGNPGGARLDDVHRLVEVIRSREADSKRVLASLDQHVPDTGRDGDDWLRHANLAAAAREIEQIVPALRSMHAVRQEIGRVSQRFAALLATVRRVVDAAEKAQRFADAAATLTSLESVLTERAGHSLLEQVLREAAATALAERDLTGSEADGELDPKLLAQQRLEATARWLIDTRKRLQQSGRVYGDQLAALERDLAEMRFDKVAAGLPHLAPADRAVFQPLVDAAHACQPERLLKSFGARDAAQVLGEILTDERVRHDLVRGRERIGKLLLAYRERSEPWLDPLRRVADTLQSARDLVQAKFHECRVEIARSKASGLAPRRLYATLVTAHRLAAGSDVIAVADADAIKSELGEIEERVGRVKEHRASLRRSLARSADRHPGNAVNYLREIEATLPHWYFQVPARVARLERAARAVNALEADLASDAAPSQRQFKRLLEAFAKAPWTRDATLRVEDRIVRYLQAGKHELDDLLEAADLVCRLDTPLVAKLSVGHRGQVIGRPVATALQAAVRSALQAESDSGRLGDLPAVQRRIAQLAVVHRFAALQQVSPSPLAPLVAAIRRCAEAAPAAARTSTRRQAREALRQIVERDESLRTDAAAAGNRISRLWLRDVSLVLGRIGKPLAARPAVGIAFVFGGFVMWILGWGARSPTPPGPGMVTLDARGLATGLEGAVAWLEQAPSAERLARIRLLDAWQALRAPPGDLTDAANRERRRADARSLRDAHEPFRDLADCPVRDVDTAVRVAMSDVFAALIRALSATWSTHLSDGASSELGAVALAFRQVSSVFAPARAGEVDAALQEAGRFVAATQQSAPLPAPDSLRTLFGRLQSGELGMLGLQPCLAALVGRALVARAQRAQGDMRRGDVEAVASMHETLRALAALAHAGIADLAGDPTVRQAIATLRL